MATVEDILMSKGPDIIVADPSTTVHEATVLMCEANVGAVVIKEQNEARGIFTERDLLRRVVVPGRNPDQIELREVMTSPVRSVSLGADVRECREIFTREHLRHLAVVEEGALLGMISLRDVLAVEVAEDEQLLQDR
ncbi:MAG: CBS domain-containing protein [Phycisphaerae bacterium]|nr:CBS domain-containing protein [Phycisphaerae bacterium]